MIATPQASLQLESEPAKVAPLDPATPLTIGRAAGNRLQLTRAAGVADHHAVVRFSASQGWLVCNWQSDTGTYLAGRRIQSCRPLADGDRIQLGPNGPVLLFRLEHPGTPPAAAVSPGRTPAAPVSAGRTPAAPVSAGACLDFDGRSLPLASIQSAGVISEPHYPQIFSWWLLLCLGGLLLLPFPLLFWPLQIGALAGWILLGSRKEHSLQVVLHDGQALTHRFANRRTALAHCGGIRRAIGQSLDSSGAS